MSGPWPPPTGSHAWLVAGWTMVHFLWVGGGIGLAGAVARAGLRRAQPEVRHAAALVCLTALALAPAAIGAHLAGALPREPGLERAAASYRASPGSRGSGLGTPREPDDAGRATPTGPGAATVPGRMPPEWAGDTLDALAAVLPGFWLAGAPATFALMAFGMIGAERLRRGSRPIVAGPLPDLARRLAGGLGLGRRVGLAACDRIAAPVLVGVVRPLILLPAAALGGGWSAEQLELVLLHELAHVRRHDNLVNLAQRLIESALFFHPAVWWASEWVRLEREHCCDRVVVRQTGRARAYAATLAALATPRGPSGRAALAMAESPVVDRIRRVLGKEDHHMKLSLGLIGPSAALLLAPAVWAIGSAAKPSPNAPVPVAEAAPAADAAAARADADATAGLFRRAIRGVEVFRNLQERAHALSRIAASQARQGDREAARQTFARALEAGVTVRMDEATYKPHILAWIAGSQVKSGFPDDARRTLREALQVAEQSPREGHASQTLDLLVRIMGIQQDLGDADDARATYERALRFIETSDDRYLRSFGAYRRLAVQADYGDFDAALRTLAEPDPALGASIDGFRDQAIGRIAFRVGTRRPQDRRAILERLRGVAGTIGDPIHKAQALQAIAESLAKLGDADAAREVSRSIDLASMPKHFGASAAFNTARVLATAGAAQARAGREPEARATFAEAVEMARAIPEDDSRRGALAHVVRQQVEAGDDAGALRTAALIGGDSLLHPIDTMESIAGRLRGSGDEAAAREHLRKALALAEEQLAAAPKGFDDEQAIRHRDRIHAAIAGLHGQLGEVEPAIAAATRISDGGAKIKALQGVARVLAHSGDPAGALRVVESIHSAAGQAEALEGVAAALPAPATVGDKPRR